MEFRAGEERLLSLGRDALKKVLDYLGGARLAGNPKAATVLGAVLARVKALGTDDARVVLPVFLDDLLDAALLRRVQEHFDARSVAWTKLYDHAVLLWKDPAAREGAEMAKLSALAEMLPALSEEEARRARDRAGARRPQAVDQPGVQGSGVASVSFQGTNFQGNVGGGSVSIGAVDQEQLKAWVAQSVVGAVNTAMAGVVKSVEQLSLRVDQQAVGVNGRLEKLMAAVGPVPEDAELKDAHVLADLSGALMEGYNSMVTLYEAHGRDPRVQAAMRAMDMVAATFVFRTLAAQKGFEAVKGFDQQAFARGTEEQRKSMIDQAKRQPKGARKSRKGPFGLSTGPQMPVSWSGPPVMAQSQPQWSVQAGPSVASPVAGGWSQVVPNQVQNQVQPFVPQLSSGNVPQPVGNVWGMCRRCGQQGHYANACKVGLQCWTCGNPGFTKVNCPRCRGQTGSPGQ